MQPDTIDPRVCAPAGRPDITPAQREARTSTRPSAIRAS